LGRATSKIGGDGKSLGRATSKITVVSLWGVAANTPLASKKPPHKEAAKKIPLRDFFS